ncbi:hypothetical protein BGZ96_002413, partial [Linnemannia gamsii]
MGKQLCPLDLPEFRTGIAQYLDIKDCVACMRVSKSWFKDLVREAWHTVDFDYNESFTQVPPDIIAKYGHLIRKTANVFKLSHVSALRHPTVDSHLELEFHVTHDFTSRAMFFDVFRQNKTSLKSLELSAHLIEAGVIHEKRRQGVFFISIDMPVSCSKLTHLCFSSLCLTRANFSDILRYSPFLNSVSIEDSMLVWHDPSSKLFRHQGIKIITASLHQVWIPDDRLP